MENRIFSRRHAFKLVGALGASLLLPSESPAKSPSELCPAHFKGLPSRMRGGNGEVYTRHKDGIYYSDSGRRMAVDGTDMILSRHFSQMEQKWKEAMETGEYVSRLLFFEDPNLDSLITAMGNEKWVSLTDSYQQKTRTAWRAKGKELRQFVCDVYLDVFKNFYKARLDEDKKSDFRRFVKAYRFAVDNSDTPENEIFRTRNGSVHKTYESYPWMCLSFPDVSDRALIFSQEVFHQNSGNRINWNFVKDRGR